MTTTRYALTVKQAQVMDIHCRARVLCSLVRPDGSVYQKISDLWCGSIRDRDAVVGYWNRLAEKTAAASGYKYEYRVLLAGC